MVNYYYLGRMLYRRRRQFFYKVTSKTLQVAWDSYYYEGCRAIINNYD